MHMQRLVFFFILYVFLIFPFVTFASTLNDGMNAMKNENYGEAIKIFRLGAEKGDKFLQHCLGVMLYKGQGVKQAEFDLGILIYYKKGVPEINEDAPHATFGKY
jgi:hypothetical protein